MVKIDVDNPRCYTTRLMICVIGIMFLFNGQAFAQTTVDPHSYFSNPEVTEVYEGWNKCGVIYHIVYRNDENNDEVYNVGTCPYYPYSPEHTVYGMTYYKDGTEALHVDFRNTGVVEGVVPPTQTELTAIYESYDFSTAKKKVEELHQQRAKGIVQNLDKEKSSNTPTPKSTPEPTPVMYNLSIIINDEDMGYAEGIGQYQEGELVTVTIFPNEGYEIDYVEGLNEKNQIEITQNHEVSVFFKAIEPIIYNVKIIVNDETMGSCTGQGDYEEGEKIILDASPKEGFEFDYWEGLDGDTFVITDSDKTVKAYFKETEVIYEAIAEIEEVTELQIQELEMVMEAQSNEIKAGKIKNKQEYIVYGGIIFGGLVVALILVLRFKKRK